MSRHRLRNVVVALAGLLAIGWPQLASGDDPAPRSREIAAIRKAVKQLQEDREKDRLLIDKLLNRLDTVETENRSLKASNEQLQGQTAQQIGALETKVEAAPSASDFSDAVRPLSRFAHLHGHRRGRRRFHLRSADRRHRRNQ